MLAICVLRRCYLCLLAASRQFRDHDGRKRGKDDQHEQHFHEGEAVRR